jgi:hypothetical protein
MIFAPSDILAPPAIDPFVPVKDRPRASQSGQPAESGGAHKAENRGFEDDCNPELTIFHCHFASHI